VSRARELLNTRAALSTNALPSVFRLVPRARVAQPACPRRARAHGRGVGDGAL
jgi:hypothetical protein